MRNMYLVPPPVRVIKKVYLDMDGVLCDLMASVGGEEGLPAAPELHHKLYLKKRQEVGAYRLFAELLPINLDSWLSLIRELAGAGKEVEILTSVGVVGPMDLGDDAFRGKADFLRRWYGDVLLTGALKRVNIVSTSRQKRHYATEDSLLLDDWERNIQQFREDGGAAVHYHPDRHLQGLDEVRRLALNP